jgi:hypothetical protein
VSDTDQSVIFHFDPEEESTNIFYKEIVNTLSFIGQGAKLRILSKYLSEREKKNIHKYIIDEIQYITITITECFIMQTYK